MIVFILMRDKMIKLSRSRKIAQIAYVPELSVESTSSVLRLVNITIYYFLVQKRDVQSFNNPTTSRRENSNDDQNEEEGKGRTKTSRLN